MDTNGSIKGKYNNLVELAFIDENYQSKLGIQKKGQYMWQIDNQSVYSPFSVCGYVIVVHFETLDM